MDTPKFKDRHEAGRALAAHLRHYAGTADLQVLALPRGGVPVGYEIARELKAPLDLFLVRKLGVPGHEEYAMGAIAAGGIRIVDESVVRALSISEDQIATVASQEQQELERRDREYRAGLPELEIEGRTIVLVDDGLATGSTMRAAAAAVRAQNPKKLIVAVPVAAPETCDALRSEVDEIICVRTPDPFHAVSLWYEAFPQTTDDEVRELLARSRAEAS